MTTSLVKGCSFGLPRVPFVNCCQFMYLVVSLLVLRAGFGIWLYQFLIIAYLFTLGELDRTASAAATCERCPYSMTGGASPSPIALAYMHVPPYRLSGDEGPHFRQPFCRPFLCYLRVLCPSCPFPGLSRCLLGLSHPSSGLSHRFLGISHRFPGRLSHSSPGHASHSLFCGDFCLWGLYPCFGVLVYPLSHRSLPPCSSPPLPLLTPSSSCPFSVAPSHVSDYLSLLVLCLLWALQGHSCPSGHYPF